MAQQQQQQQQEEYMRQQMALAEQQRQQEEYMRQQQMLQQQQQQALFAQPTGYGSNNPFAPQTSLLQHNPQVQQQPTPTFLPVPTVTPQPSSPPRQQVQPQRAATPTKAFPAPKRDDGEHSHLAGLLARGREDGLDTFGNMGNLREFSTPSIDGVRILMPNLRVRRKQPIRSTSTTAATTDRAE